MTHWPQEWLVPKWPAPRNVRACVTTRQGGVSLAPFDAFNLGDHVGDDPLAVAANRQRLHVTLGCLPAWLKQTHSTIVTLASEAGRPQADASWTDVAGLACAVLTADCLPVLFCDRDGHRVAAAHAGWRGLAGGILEHTVAELDVAPDRLMAWLGPAIGPASFEVGGEVREAFVTSHAAASKAFVPSRNPGRYMADLYHLARIRLAACGVTDVYGGGFCTFQDPRFYSYRRESHTGRFASLIWLD
ncbi:peptidoglycan editing factor PgeF [Stutzerimonas chloritidismutans]|uniref:peptidoglycan editing factor PgeF n=1 Tax=Stutzerimonas chloritidismutans TaxID=203192 RepID=UPI003F179579